MFTNRDIVKVIIFSIITCGIYDLYWSYVTMEALDAEGESSNMPVIVQFILLFFYVGYIIFALNADSNLNGARAKRGLAPKDNKVLYLLLGIFCPIALVALVQNEINEMA